MDQIGVGIIGTGAVAQVAHLPVLSRMKDVNIEAICDIDLARARDVAAKFNISRVYRDYQSLLDLDYIDAVLICLPTYLNPPIAIAALKANKHVLCEKPLAKTSQEGKMMVDTAKRLNKHLVPGYNFRYRSESIILKEMLREEKLGRIWSIEAKWFVHPETLTLSPWKLDFSQSGGGVMMDLGTHLLDTLFWIIESRPTWVMGNVQYRNEKSFIDNFATVDILTESGVYAKLTTSWHYLRDQEFNFIEIQGSLGNASFSPLLINVFTENKVKSITPPLDTPTNVFKLSYRNELRYFFDIIRGLYPPQQNVMEDWELNRLVELIYQSSYESRPIKF